MAPLSSVQNISWLWGCQTSARGRRYSAGFQAVEAAWLYDTQTCRSWRAREATGVESESSSTLRPEDVKAGELGLGAVPGRSRVQMRSGSGFEVCKP
ncbi:putative hydroxypyruvate isomerase [Lates japonicus]|uniref:Hydroxypyruvate isomerase n=1 Tax=Lates japonicus TaxID=270547 RepID=A0AAD3NI13_LATJO|nr:putative hydroxypyruvate isomerase [Lates japonicus]